MVKMFHMCFLGLQKTTWGEQSTNFKPQQSSTTFPSCARDSGMSLPFQVKQSTSMLFGPKHSNGLRYLRHVIPTERYRCKNILLSKKSFSKKKGCVKRRVNIDHMLLHVKRRTFTCLSKGYQYLSRIIISHYFKCFDHRYLLSKKLIHIKVNMKCN